jgi:acyl-coenzyme A thioesterase PaaI-like protein
VTGAAPNAGDTPGPPGGASLQDRYAPKSICFGCGPANDQGLRIKSFVEGDTVVASFTPAPHHHAFPGIVNGGILGALLDCHSNWTAAHHLMQKAGLDAPPCTVTADFHVKLRRPTPMGPLQLRAHVNVTESTNDRAVVEAEILAGDQVTARCTGTFVAVKEGHPAFYRW